MDERICKGIFIPIEIWKNKDLSWNEKILFLEIDSFSDKEKECFISNEYISDLLQVNETTANKVLSSLIKKGYVIKTRFDGRRRFVKTAFAFDRYQETEQGSIAKKASQGCANAQGSIALLHNIPNTYTNIDYIKEDKDKSLSKKDPIDYDFIKSEWERINPDLSSIRGYNDKRKKSLRCLLDKNKATVDDLIKSFEIISVCSFCQGNNNRGWKATFDWLINDTKSCFNRLLEGCYAMSEEEKNKVDSIISGINLPLHNESSEIKFQY